MVILDVVIGLVFIYLLYSLLATILQEMIANWLNFRAKILERAIFRMLDDNEIITSRIHSVKLLFSKTLLNSGTKNLFQEGINSKEIEGVSNTPLHEEFYEHPLIKYLGENSKGKKPSYITSETFSKVVIDLLKGNSLEPGGDTRNLINDALNSEVAKWGNNHIAPQTLKYLKSIWVDANGDVERFREMLETWFDNMMERATGWYKKNIQIILLGIGFFIAVLFNVDTIQIARKLQKDPKLREQIVQQADAFMKAHPDLTKELAISKERYQQFLRKNKGNQAKLADSLALLNTELLWDNKQLETLVKTQDSLLHRADSIIKTDIKKTNDLLGIGIGTYFKELMKLDTCRWVFYQTILLAILGWLLTALAISLGAPFWFDLLNKLMKLRNSVSTISAEKSQSGQNSNVTKVKRVG